jgi:hypothetical protein
VSSKWWFLFPLRKLLATKNNGKHMTRWDCCVFVFGFFVLFWEWRSTWVCWRIYEDFVPKVWHVWRNVVEVVNKKLCNDFLKGIFFKKVFKRVWYWYVWCIEKCIQCLGCVCWLNCNMLCDGAFNFVVIRRSLKKNCWYA